MAAPESGYLLPSLILAIIFSISTTINPIFSEDSGSWEFSSGNSGSDSGQVLGFQDGVTKSTFAVGLEHFCWISIDDSVYCQGSNYYSQLGIVGVSVKSNKIDLGEFGKPEILSSGEFHTCSITERSIVVCWGFDTHGQSSGNPGAGEYAVGPTNIDLGGLAAVAISSGKYHSCALTVGGGVFCWGTFGGSVPGESGNFEGFPEEIIDGITSHAISISSGDHHACSLIINRSVKCWGDNKYQQLGSDNYGEFFNSPVLVTNHSRVMAISLNGDSSCSLKLSGELECWGRGIGGIGSGEEIDYSVQNIEHSVINPLVISSGGGSVCLIGDLGETGCWGAMGEVAIPAIRPSIAISEKQYCYVAIEKSALECSALQHSSSQPIDVGEVRLNDMDLDLDGVLDHMDDFPRDPGRSVICQPGEFGRHYCEKAPPGFFVKNANSQNPEPCPVGTFQSEYGKDHCLVSPPGSYVDSPASALPTYCPPGTFSAEVGQIFQDCVEAEPGNWAPGGTGIQLSCPAGSFQPEGGRENCILAGPGRFSVNESSTFDIPCQIGAFQPLEGQSGCTVSDSGHYVDQVGSQSQTPCPRGTYNPKIGSTSPDDCYPVSPGNFSLEGSAEPIECPPGTFQPDWGRGSCLESTPGFFVGSPGADSQTPCEPGKYQPNHSQTECMEAIPGYYTNKAGAAEITPCPVGTFQNESGSSACIYSSRGFFVDSPGSANQEHCPAGKYSSVEGAISRSICATVQAGYYSLNGSSSATPCPVGTFQPETGQPSCLNATVGFFVDDIGSIQQEKCPENSTTIGASAVSTEDCVTPMPGFYITNSGFAPCPKGTYQPLPAQHFCINATAGHFVDHIGSNAQTPCPAGTFSDADVSTSSEVCQTAPVGSFAPGGEAEARIAEPGYYVDLQGSESQTPCPDGTFSEVTGATSYEACQIVQPGEFSESGSSEAIPCPIGTFQPYEGQSECIEASPGHYSEIMGSIAQLPCTIGYFQPNSSQTSCLPAEVGFFVATASAEAQAECPQYMTTVGPASVSEGACLSDIGHYTLEDGSAERCLSGAFQPSLGEFSCIFASPGQYVEVGAADSQIPCPPGTFSDSWGAVSQDACQTVSAGHFSQLGSAEEIPCPVGFYQPEPGKDHCLGSDPGYYSPVPGTVEQIPCLPGTYQPINSSFECNVSDPGHYTDIAAATTQIECEAGSYQSFAGSFECVLSEPGFYVPSNASDSQIECKIGTFQPLAASTGCILAFDGHFVATYGSDRQEKCEAGTFRNSIDWRAGDRCLVTGRGKYSEEGASVPIPCPPGTYAGAPGSGSLSDCIGTIPGTYASESGSIGPTLCQVGEYQPENRATSCLKAPFDTFVPEIGSSAYRPCSSGGYTLSENSDSSDDCIFDQDGDGIVDREDKLVHIEGEVISIYDLSLVFILNVMLVSTVPREKR